ncbi:MAG: hypothetical protein JNL98_32530 [Bryobacterales bacterium]|nr:hypothetical protein [Bryobacterales bacterium]
MSLNLVLLAYGLAFVLALALLSALRSLHWYWHAIFLDGATACRRPASASTPS